MKTASLALLSALLSGCGAGEPDVKAIVGATLVTASGQRISPGVVVVKGTRIWRVGTQADTPVPAGAEKVEGYGKFVTPEGDEDLTPGAEANLRLFAADPRGADRPPERVLREGAWIR